MGQEHTPGPWAAEPADMFGDHNIVRGDSDEALAVAAVVSNMRPADQVEANARLIAAAPDLLEALRSLVGNAGALAAFAYEIRQIAGNTNWQCLMDSIDKADAALRKASAS